MTDMGRKDMPNDDIERVLREHFKAEASDLRAPSDPWGWLESRLEPQPSRPFLRRLLSTGRGRFYAASAATAMFVVAIAAAWTAAWMVVGDIGDDQPHIAMLSEESPSLVGAVVLPNVDTGGPSLPKPPWLSTRSSPTTDPAGPRGEPGLPGTLARPTRQSRRAGGTGSTSSARTRPPAVQPLWWKPTASQSVWMTRNRQSRNPAKQC